MSLLGAAAVLEPMGTTAAATMHRTTDVLGSRVLADALGPAPADAPMRVQVALTDPQAAEETALAAAVVDPRSPDYRQFLTPSQYADRFRLPAAVRSEVLRWLRAGGVRVDRVSGVGDLIAVTGTVASLQRLFAVHLDTYQLDGHRFVANDTPPLVPGPVRAVLGLNTWQHFAPVRPAAPQQPTDASDPPGPIGRLGSDTRVGGPRHQLGAYAGNVDVRKLWTAYDAPPGDQGQGVRMGVFMAGNAAPIIGSLRVFEAAEQLPRVPVRVVRAQPGQPDEFATNDGSEEWSLDTQAASGMAPQVSELDLYTAKSLQDADVVGEFAYWADDKTGPELMNASFGACEATPLTSQTGRGPLSVAIGNNIQDSVEKSLRQAFTEGRTVFAAAGDSGSSCAAVSLPVVGGGNGVLNQGVPAQLYPAASPYVTSVGGTVVALKPDGSREKEETWAFTGGGSALFIPRPDWQSAEAAINRPCLLTDADGVPQPPGTICRGVPDIATLSGNITQGLYIVNYDKPTNASGTSLSSPLAMGSWARVVAAARTRIGPVAPAVYRLSPTQRTRDFYDVTKGEAIGNGLNIPGPGWDYTSGYGVPDIAHLAADLGGGIVPVHPPKHPAKVPDPQTGTLAGNQIACLPFGTSPVGNIEPSTFGDPGTTRDITSAAMDLSPDGQSLVITVSGPQLGPEVELGSGGTTMEVDWTYQGQTWAAESIATLGQVNGTVRMVSRNADAVPAGPRPTRTVVQARYEGHALIMTIPLSAIGSPPRGARLSEPVVISGSDGGAEDVAGPQYDYTVGQRCRH
ncbi:MAG TPA: S53 family peptidase [Sporichthyaceae bacterium]|nr:S53 family peptidase [Sporichthyaceae bacterium]